MHRYYSSLIFVTLIVTNVFAFSPTTISPLTELESGEITSNNDEPETVTQEEATTTIPIPISDLQYACELRNVESDTEQRRKSVKLVASLINLKNFREAVIEFQSLDKGENPQNYISDIVKKVYQQEKNNEDFSYYLRNLNRFLDFLKNSEHGGIDCEFYQKFGQSLGEQLKNNRKWTNWQESWKIISLSSRIQTECLNNTKAYTKNPLLPLTNKLFENWAKEIKEGDFKEILWILKKPEMSSHYPKIIQVAYSGNKTNFDQVARFNKKVKSLPLRAQGWLSLLNELKNSGREHSQEMAKFARWTKKDIINKGENFDQSSVKMFNNVVKETPVEIAKMFWSNRCTIKNIKSGQYLTVYENDDESSLNQTDVLYAGDKIESGSWWNLDYYLKQYKHSKINSEDDRSSPSSSVSKNKSSNQTKFYDNREANVNAIGNALLSIPLAFLSLLREFGSAAKADVVHYRVKRINWRKTMPYLSIKDTKSWKSLATGDPSFYFKTGVKSDWMTNWVLEPVVMKNGEKAWHMFTWNRHWKRFDLYVGDKDVQVNGGNVMGKNILAKEDAFKLEESYWKIDCE